MTLKTKEGRRRLRNAILAAGVMLGGCGGQALAGSDLIEVELDQAKLVHLDEPAAEIVVGNPSIADVSVQSSTLLVVTGKSFGRTNLIVIGPRGKQILNSDLSVVDAGEGLVTLHKGSDKAYTVYCAPKCGPSLAIGDNTDYFDATQKQISSKQSLGQQGSSGGSGGPQ